MEEKNKNDEIVIIQSTGILDNDVFKKITDIRKELEDGFNKQQHFRPRFLMETSVLNEMKFPTADAKYWQSNVERDTHFKNLVFLSFDYKEKQADIKILEAELHGLELKNNENTELTEAQKEKKKVQIARERQHLVYMEKEAYERVREILNWTDIMQQLEPDMKYSKDNVEAHMPEAYALRFAREREAMQIAGAENAAHDLAGAMNIISLTKSMFSHPSVIKLIDEEQKAKL